MQPEVPGNQSDSNPPQRNPKNVFYLALIIQQPLGLSFWLQGYQKTTLRKQAALFEQMPFTVAHLLILRREPYQIPSTHSLTHPLTHSLIHHHSSSTTCHSFGGGGRGFLLLTNVSCGFGHLSSCWGDFAMIDEKVYETVI